MMCRPLFKTATQLLPSNFIKLAESSKDLSARKLENLNEATVSWPWYFGCRQILYDEFDVMDIEAQMPAWRRFNLIQNVPAVKRDAFYIYHALKLISKREGHTHV